MRRAITEEAAIDELLHNALSEDLGMRGDITSAAIFSPSDTARAIIKSKEPGILSGSYLLTPLFSKIDHGVLIHQRVSDGAALERGTVICELQGPIRSILAGERIALNFLQRLSGIASATAQLTSRIAHTKAKLLDTRKTTPGFRLLEKRAVRDGGGTNHRFGLYDMILIKDTHVKAAGGIANAIRKSKLFANAFVPPVKVEAEVQSIEEFQQAISEMPDIIMLDNMCVVNMTRCVELRNGSHPEIKLEASGNVSQATIAAIAETGVDFISAGSITHSVMALDMHLVIV